MVDYLLKQFLGQAVHDLPNDLVRARPPGMNRRPAGVKSGKSDQVQKTANFVTKTSALEIETSALEVANFRRGSWQLLGRKFLKAILRQNCSLAPLWRGPGLSASAFQAHNAVNRVQLHPDPSGLRRKAPCPAPPSPCVPAHSHRHLSQVKYTERRWQWLAAAATISRRHWIWLLARSFP
jgi:hypothetical protein